MDLDMCQVMVLIPRQSFQSGLNLLGRQQKFGVERPNKQREVHLFTGWLEAFFQSSNKSLMIDHARCDDYSERLLQLLSVYHFCRKKTHLDCDLMAMMIMPMSLAGCSLPSTKIVWLTDE